MDANAILMKRLPGLTQAPVSLFVRGRDTARSKHMSRGAKVRKLQEICTAISVIERERHHIGAKELREAAESVSRLPQLPTAKRMLKLKEAERQAPVYDNTYLAKLTRDPTMGIKSALVGMLMTEGQDEPRFMTLSQKAIFIINPKKSSRKIRLGEVSGILECPSSDNHLGIVCNRFEYDLCMMVTNAEMKEHFVANLNALFKRDGRRLRFYESEPVTKYLRLTEADVGKEVIVPLVKGQHDELALSKDPQAILKLAPIGDSIVNFSSKLGEGNGALAVTDVNIIDFDEEFEIIHCVPLSQIQALYTDEADPKYICVELLAFSIPCIEYMIDRRAQFIQFIERARPDIQKSSLSDYIDKLAANPPYANFSLEVDNAQAVLELQCERKLKELLDEKLMRIIEESNRHLEEKESLIKMEMDAVCNEKLEALAVQVGFMKDEHRRRRLADADVAATAVRAAQIKSAEQEALLSTDVESWQQEVADVQDEMNIHQAKMLQHIRLKDPKLEPMVQRLLRRIVQLRTELRTKLDDALKEMDRLNRDNQRTQAKILSTMRGKISDLQRRHIDSSAYLQKTLAAIAEDTSAMELAIISSLRETEDAIREGLVLEIEELGAHLAKRSRPESYSEMQEQYRECLVLRAIRKSEHEKFRLAQQIEKQRLEEILYREELQVSLESEQVEKARKELAKYFEFVQAKEDGIETLGADAKGISTMSEDLYSMYGQLEAVSNEALRLECTVDVQYMEIDKALSEEARAVQTRIDVLERELAARRVGTLEHDADMKELDIAFQSLSHCNAQLEEEGRTIQQLTDEMVLKDHRGREVSARIREMENLLHKVVSDKDLAVAELGKNAATATHSYQRRNELERAIEEERDERLKLQRRISEYRAVRAPRATRDRIYAAKKELERLTSTIASERQMLNLDVERVYHENATASSHTEGQKSATKALLDEINTLDHGIRLMTEKLRETRFLHNQDPGDAQLLVWQDFLSSSAGLSPAAPRATFGRFQPGAYTLSANRETLVCAATANPTVALVNQIIATGSHRWRYQVDGGGWKIGVGLHTITTQCSAGDVFSWVLTSNGECEHNGVTRGIMSPLLTSETVTVELDLVSAGSPLRFSAGEQFGTGYTLMRRNGPFVPVVELRRAGGKCTLLSYETLPNASARGAQ